MRVRNFNILCRVSIIQMLVCKDAGENSLQLCIEWRIRSWSHIQNSASLNNRNAAVGIKSLTGLVGDTIYLLFPKSTTSDGRRIRYTFTLECDILPKKNHFAPFFWCKHAEKKVKTHSLRHYILFFFGVQWSTTILIAFLCTWKVHQ